MGTETPGASPATHCSSPVDILSSVYSRTLQQAFHPQRTVSWTPQKAQMTHGLSILLSGPWIHSWTRKLTLPLAVLGAPGGSTLSLIRIRFSVPFGNKGKDWTLKILEHILPHSKNNTRDHQCAKNMGHGNTFSENDAGVFSPRNWKHLQSRLQEHTLYL